MRDETQRWTQGWRQLMLATGMLVYPFVTAAGVLQYSRGADAATGLTLVIVFCVCYVLAALAAARRAMPWYWLLVAVMTLLLVAVSFSAHGDSFYLAAVIVSMAVVRAGRAAIPVAAVGTLASFIVPWVVPSWHEGAGWTQAIAVVFTVLTVYAFTEIARANAALVEARAEVARLASEAERNRIARDLHDLVGHSLTAITVKSNLARQLAAGDDSPAAAEIADVERLSRQALTDLRAAVSGYHEVTLAGELARGKELLRASGVTADLPTAAEIVDAADQELFGWAVREGITNVVRHAHASRCTVAVSATTVEVRDDGVGGPASAGNGLSGLRERVAAAGGSVDAGPAEPRGWRLRVSLGTASRA